MKKSLTTVLAAAAACALTLSLAACGSSTPTLHGTATLTPGDLGTLSAVPGFRPPCGSITQDRPQKSSQWRVRVSADGAYVGSAPLSWLWSKHVDCVGTWNMGVPHARLAYAVRVVFYGLSVNGTTVATTTVQPSHAGELIRMGGGS